jgi:hypothetical protein
MSKNVILLLFSFSLFSISLFLAALAWQGPTGNPPGSNLAPPVYTDTSPQTKPGVLGLGGLKVNYFTFLASEGGNVGIGTTNPQAKFHIKVNDTLTPSFRVEIMGIGFPLGGWNYRKSITVSNPGSELTNYQVLITLNTASLISAGKMRSDCGDVRFTDSDGSTLLNYWIESGCNTNNTKVWIKVPSIPTNSTKTIYFYYGNPSANSASNPNATFEGYDPSAGDTDANIKSVYYPNQNYVSDPQWLVGGWGDYYYTLLKIPRSVIPGYINQNNIISAILYAYSWYFNNNWSSQTQRFDIRYITSSWNPTTVTWYSQPSIGSTIYTSPAVNIPGRSSTTPSWFAINITPWAQNTTYGLFGSNYGLAIIPYYIGGAWYTAHSLNNTNRWYVVIQSNTATLRVETIQLGSSLVWISRKFVSPEPTTSVGEEEVPRLQPQTAFYIQNQTGNVGIGTTAPLSKLGVVGGVIYTGDTNTRFGAQISGDDGGRAVFGSNLYVASDYTLRTFGTHDSYGYSGVEAAWGALKFYTASGATTQDARVFPTPRMIIDSSGNVGIGTTSPLTKLYVSAGDIATGGVSTKVWAGYGANYIRMVEGYPATLESYGPMQFKVFGNPPSVTAMYITTGGNVGIGTTAPNRKLELVNDVSGLSFEAGTGSPNSGVIRFGDNTGWKLHFGRSRNSPGGALNSGTAGVLMTIQDNGNVGIGTTAPMARLAVMGDVGIGRTDVDNAQGWARTLTLTGGPHAKLLVTETTAGVKTGIFSHSSWGGTVGRIGTESPHHLRLMAGYGNDVVTITTGGNVGIGTTSPVYKLEVVGSVGANAYYYRSDIRLKENVEKANIDNILEKISKIEAIKYTLDGQKQIGISAQEVEKVFPDIVVEKNGEKSIDLKGLVTILLEAIKKQNEKIKNLEEKIEILTKGR